MRQYAIIGLGSFGLHMLEGLREITNEIIIIDRDASIIEKHKDEAGSAFVADAIDDETLRKIIPEHLDVAIVDVAASLENSILITHALKKLGVAEIVIKAQNTEQGGILKMIGATQIIYPDLEAARRVTPLLVSPGLFNFMPIGESLVIAEARIPDRFVGMSLVEANLRHNYRINVIAIHAENSSTYEYFTADYKLKDTDILLVAGTEKDVITFSGAERKQAGASRLNNIFKDLLKGITGKK